MVETTQKHYSLTVGSALGLFKGLLAKIKAIDAKHGKFEMVLATGDFFGDPAQNSSKNELTELLEGKLEGRYVPPFSVHYLTFLLVPIQVYIMQGKHPLPQVVIDKVTETGGQLCHNIFLLSMFNDCRGSMKSHIA